MIKRLFDFWKCSKEQKAAKLAMKLVSVLNEIGRIPAHDGDAAAIRIYEYSHVDDRLKLNGGHEDNISILFNHKGEILK